MPSSSDQPVEHKHSAFDSSQLYQDEYLQGRSTGYKAPARARRKHELAGEKENGENVNKDRVSRLLPKEL